VNENLDSAQDDPTPPKVDFLFSLDPEGRYQCLHPDCSSKTYTFLWKNGFQDHWLDKHTTEDEKVSEILSKKYFGFFWTLEMSTKRASICIEEASQYTLCQNC